MVKIDRIYTKRGDRGETDLADGERVSKDSNRVVAYGDVDELNTLVGTARTIAEQQKREPLAEYLRNIQNDLFDLGTGLAFPSSPSARLSEEKVKCLETWLDLLIKDLPPLNSFVLPGGTILNAALHQCRAVCRRAERHVVRLNRTEQVPSEILSYLNRLSDLFFAMARFESAEAGAAEYLWEPGGKS